jgi:hypothetical protein
MNTFKISIKRVFKESSVVVRNRLIRLVGESNKKLTLTQLMGKVGWKFVVLSLSTHKKAAARIRLYYKFTSYLFVMNKRHGGEFLVKYLKASHLAVSKYLAGEPFHSLREIEPDLPLPRLSSSGLPCIIGTRDRKSLELKSPKIIRLYLNLFSLYRVISIPGKVKLSTITDDFSGNLQSLKNLENWIGIKSPSVLLSFLEKIKLQQMEKFLISEKSSPTSSKSWTGMVVDICLLKTDPVLYNCLQKIMKVTCTPSLNSFFKGLSDRVPSAYSFSFDWLLLNTKDVFKRDVVEYNQFSALEGNKLFIPSDVRGLGLGQLSTALEAAGKVRVFAMVDSWTQTACHALHNYLMDLLNQIPNDGSKDHGVAFERAVQKAVKYGCCYGYDLSAATDRLPLSLQTRLISTLFGKDFAESWSTLLVGRHYSFYDKDENVSRSIRYAVGQPMGAKSSWTMLALTHHMVMQYCSWRLGYIGWCVLYEIVGDDIVIFSRDLAKEYLHVMSAIGVPINSSKSVVSKGGVVCEFVKRISVKGNEVSAFSWKQFLSQDTLLGRINTTIGLFLKEREFLGSRAISVFNTVLKERSYDTRPFSDVLALVSLYTTYALKSGMKLEYILRALHLGNPVIEDNALVFKSFDINRIGSFTKAMILTGQPKVEQSFYANLIPRKELVSESFVKQLHQIRNKYWLQEIDEAHQKIIGLILKGLDLSSPLGIELSDFIDKYLKEIHDPIMDYPWIRFYLQDNCYWSIFDINRKSLNMSFIKKLSFMKWNLDVFDSIKYSKLTPLEISSDLLTRWQSKITFLELPDRVSEVPKEVILNISDIKMLSLLTSALKLVKNHPKYRP